MPSKVELLSAWHRKNGVRPQDLLLASMSEVYEFREFKKSEIWTAGIETRNSPNQALAADAKGRAAEAQRIRQKIQMW